MSKSCWRHKVVRDLEWVMSCPHLLSSESGMPLLDDGWSARLVRGSADWLAAIDADPSELLAWLKMKGFGGRLGFYFGSLVEWWIRRCPLLGATNIECDMLLKNIRDNRTLGSLKFVFESLWYRPPAGHILLPPCNHGSNSAQHCRDKGEVQLKDSCGSEKNDMKRPCVLHFEASVKYFLQLPGATSTLSASADAGCTSFSKDSCSSPLISSGVLPPPPPPLAFYVGPFLKENLAWRVHVAQRKLLLADSDSVRDVLRSRFSSGGSNGISSHFLLRGWIFEPLLPTSTKADCGFAAAEGVEDEINSPVSPGCLRGSWTCDVDAMLCISRDSTPIQPRWAILHKLHWLSPARATCSGAGKDRESIAQDFRLQGEAEIDMPDTPLLCEAELQAAIKTHFLSTDAPVLIAELHPSRGERTGALPGVVEVYHEVRRTFLLHPRWNAGDLNPSAIATAAVPDGALSRRTYDSAMRSSKSQSSVGEAATLLDVDTEVSRGVSSAQRHCSLPDTMAALLHCLKSINFTARGDGYLKSAAELVDVLHENLCSVSGTGKALKRHLRELQRFIVQYLREIEDRATLGAVLAVAVQRLFQMQAVWPFASLAHQAANVVVGVWRAVTTPSLRPTRRCVSRVAMKPDNAPIVSVRNATIRAQFSLCIASALAQCTAVSQRRADVDDIDDVAVWLFTLLKAARAFFGSADLRTLSTDAISKMSIPNARCHVRDLVHCATERSNASMMGAAIELHSFCALTSGAACSIDEEAELMLKWMLQHGNTEGAEELVHRVSTVDGNGTRMQLQLVNWLSSHGKLERARRVVMRYNLDVAVPKANAVQSLRVSQSGAPLPVPESPTLALGMNATILLVDTDERVQLLCHDVQDALRARSYALQSTQMDIEKGGMCKLSHGCCALVGLDAEWPHGGSAALLQLLLPSADGSATAALFDLQALGESVECCNFITWLFNHDQVVIVGYGLKGDLEKLRAARKMWNWSVREALELNTLVEVALSPSCNEPLPLYVADRGGLSTLCVACLGARLDKGQQCSDWGSRPLSTAQIRYAALDAAVLPILALHLSYRVANVLGLDVDPKSTTISRAFAARAGPLAKGLGMAAGNCPVLELRTSWINGESIASFTHTVECSRHLCAAKELGALGCANVLAAAARFELATHGGPFPLIDAAKRAPVDAVVVKTLGLVVHGPDGHRQPIVCVLALSSRLSVRAVAALCGGDATCTSVKFASRKELVALHGYQPGSLGPVGLREHGVSTPTLFDQSLCIHKHLLCGAGEEGLVIPFETRALIAAVGGRVCDIIKH